MRNVHPANSRKLKAMSGDLTGNLRVLPARIQLTEVGLEYEITCGG